VQPNLVELDHEEVDNSIQDVWVLNDFQ
jgi:hypothetical protein